MPADRSGIGRRAFLGRFFSLAAAYLLAQRLSKANPAPQHPAADAEEIVALPVKYPSSGATLQGYLARPAGAGTFPAIIIEDRFASGTRLREAAHDYARAGFVALVMDPLSRRGGAAAFPSVEASREALAAIRPAQQSADLASARAFLQSHSSVQPDQVRIAKGH